VSTLYVVLSRLLELVVLFARGDRAKELEILVLRHELSILRRQSGRPRFEAHDRLLLAALSRVLPRHSWNAFLVRPETLLRWHRRMVARRWTYGHRRPGRPPIGREVRQLVLRLARENPSWGYLRIVGELRKLGVAVSSTSVRNILAGLRPAPRRDSQSWRSFLRAHGESILACDLFTIDTVWLKRLYVLVFLSLGSRRIEYFACTSNPKTAWMLQQARNLLMELDDRDRRVGFLIHDRDAKFPGAFRCALGEREDQGHPDAGAGAERERAHGALGRHSPPRMPRPAADPRPSPARTRPPRLRPSLQPTAAAPGPQPESARGEPSLSRPSRVSAARSSCEPPRPARRPHPRVRHRCRVTIEFLHPTGARRLIRRDVGSGRRRRV
jgi:hypothetical protein